MDNTQKAVAVNVDKLADVIKYTTKCAWNGATNHALVVDCSDPRLTDGRDEFLKGAFGFRRYDSVFVPGGPGAVVTPAPSCFMERERISMLHNLHGFGKIIAIAHEDCGYYKHAHPEADAEERRRLQIADLEKFNKEMRGLMSGIEVETFFASPDENGFTQYTRIS